MNRNPNLVPGSMAIALHVAVIGALVIARPAADRPPRLDYVEMINTAVLAPDQPPAPRPPAPKVEPTPVKPQPVKQVAQHRPVAPTVSAQPDAPTIHSPAEPVRDTSSAPVQVASSAPPAQIERPAPPIETQPVFSAAYLSNPKPVYPPLSMELQEQGTVMVRAQVSEKGLPIVVEVSSSSGFPRLDRAALEAVKRWRFVPAKRGDDPIVGSVIIPLNFNLLQA
ncbi:energy transducer TonB [Chitinivorax sp. B]|uniref:energy transducer TonB n=1 Tax=Chitinivorax sp. B TaxID=2502235 RepID=UPI0020178295|nr:energy transducer TonB [Chitinivorax sp. B]